MRWASDGRRGAGARMGWSWVGLEMATKKVVSGVVSGWSGASKYFEEQSERGKRRGGEDGKTAPRPGEP